MPTDAQIETAGLALLTELGLGGIYERAPWASLPEDTRALVTRLVTPVIKALGATLWDEGYDAAQETADDCCGCNLRGHHQQAFNPYAKEHPDAD